MLKNAMYVKEVTRQGQMSIAPLTVSIDGVLTSCWSWPKETDERTSFLLQTWPQYGTKRSAKNTLHALLQALGEDVLEDTFLHMTYVL